MVLFLLHPLGGVPSYRHARGVCGIVSKMSIMPKECLSCQRTFITAYSLKKHKKKRHEEDSDLMLPAGFQGVPIELLCF